MSHWFWRSKSYWFLTCRSDTCGPLEWWPQHISCKLTRDCMALKWCSSHWSCRSHTLVNRLHLFEFGSGHTLPQGPSVLQESWSSIESVSLNCSPRSGWGTLMLTASFHSLGIVPESRKGSSAYCCLLVDSCCWRAADRQLARSTGSFLVGNIDSRVRLGRRSYQLLVRNW